MSCECHTSEFVSVASQIMYIRGVLLAGLSALRLETDRTGRVSIIGALGRAGTGDLSPGRALGLDW